MSCLETLFLDHENLREVHINVFDDRSVFPEEEQASMTSKTLEQLRDRFKGRLRDGTKVKLGFLVLFGETGTAQFNFKGDSRVWTVVKK